VLTRPRGTWQLAAARFGRVWCHSAANALGGPVARQGMPGKCGNDRKRQTGGGLMSSGTAARRAVSTVAWPELPRSALAARRASVARVFRPAVCVLLVDKIRSSRTTWPGEASAVPQRAGTGPMARSGTLRRGTRTKHDRPVIRVEFCIIGPRREARGATFIRLVFYFSPLFLAWLHGGR
jgi:hypothetical protein